MKKLIKKEVSWWPYSLSSAGVVEELIKECKDLLEQAAKDGYNSAEYRFEPDSYGEGCESRVWLVKQETDAEFEERIKSEKFAAAQKEENQLRDLIAKASAMGYVLTKSQP